MYIVRLELSTSKGITISDIGLKALWYQLLTLLEVCLAIYKGPQKSK